MAKLIGKNMTVFAGGMDISGELNSVSLNRSTETPDVTGFGNPNYERLSNSLDDVEISFSGFYNNSPSSTGSLFDSLLGASSAYGFYQNGASYMGNGKEVIGYLSEYNIVGDVSAAIGVDANIVTTCPMLFANSLGLIQSASFNTSASASLTASFSGSTPSQYAVFRVLGLDRSNGNEQVTGCILTSSDGAALGWTTLYVFDAASGAGFWQISPSSAASSYRLFRYQFSGTSPFSACFVCVSGSIPD